MPSSHGSPLDWRFERELEPQRLTHVRYGRRRPALLRAPRRPAGSGRASRRPRYLRPDRPPRDVLAVDDLDLRIGRGETVALLGPNAAGKSSTVGAVLGLLRPAAGRVRVLGRDVGALSNG